MRWLPGNARSSWLKHSPNTGPMQPSKKVSVLCFAVAAGACFFGCCRPRGALFFVVVSVVPEAGVHSLASWVLRTDSKRTTTANGTGSPSAKPECSKLYISILGIPYPTTAAAAAPAAAAATTTTTTTTTTSTTYYY